MPSELKPPVHDLLQERLWWVRSSIVEAIRQSPSLAEAALRAEPWRLHLLAYVSVTREDQLTVDTAAGILSEPSRRILARWMNRKGDAARQILESLPKELPEPQLYRQLQICLRQRQTARLLYWIAKHRDGRLLVILLGLPPLLRYRPVIEGLAEFFGRRVPSQFECGLRTLAHRLGERSPRRIMQYIGAAQTKRQFMKRMRALFLALPPLPPLPAKRIGHAKRIEDSRRSLVLKSMHLTRHIRLLDPIRSEGMYYEWRIGSDSGICRLEQSGRLGWFMNGIYRKRSLLNWDDQSRKLLSAEFANAGVPDIKPSIGILGIAETLFSSALDLGLPTASQIPVRPRRFWLLQKQ